MANPRRPRRKSDHGLTRWTFAQRRKRLDRRWARKERRRVAGYVQLTGEEAQ